MSLGSFYANICGTSEFCDILFNKDPLPLTVLATCELKPMVLMVVTGIVSYH